MGGQHVRQHLLEAGLSVEPQQMIGALVGTDAVVACAQGFRPCSRELLTEIGVC